MGRERVPFFGRSGELHTLRALASTGRGSAPAAAVVVGLPGMGKSRLLSEAARTVGMPLVRLQGYQTAREISLAAAGGLLRALTSAPEVGKRLDALILGEAGKSIAPEPVRLFEFAFRCVLAIGALGVVADDIHWMDRETLALLQYLVAAAEGAGAPLFVVCAGRPAPEAATFAMQLAATVPHERFAHIHLGPLDERDGVDLMTALVPGLAPDRAARMCRQASGSPFWIAAVAAEMSSRTETDDSLQQLIRNRCANLGVDPAALFALMLVSAQPLSTDGVGEVLGWPAARVQGAVLELINRALLLQDGSMISISHDLIRETAVRELGEDVRVRMHRRLAEWLEASAGTSVPLLIRALEHRSAAGLDADDLALRIAHSPQRRLVGLDGLSMLGDIADAAAGESRSDLQRAVASLAYEVGEWSISLERWSALVDRLPRGPDRAAAALAAAAAALKVNRSFELHAFTASARAAADGDPVLAIEADCMDAQSLLWIEGNAAEAQPLVDRAMAAAESLMRRAGGIARLDDRASAAYVRALRANLDAAIRRADSGTVRHCAELIQHAARDPAEVLAAASDGVFSLLQFDGLPRSAEPRAKRALEESRRLSMPGLEVEATHWVGWIAHHLGRLEEASAVMQRAIALAERIGAPRRFTVPQLRAVLFGIEASRSDWQSNTSAIARLITTEPNPHFRLVIRTIHVGLVGRFSAPAEAELLALTEDMARDAQVAGCGRCLWESVLHGAEASARIGSTAAAEQALKRWDESHPDAHPGGPMARRAYVDALLTSHRDAAASLEPFARAAHAAEDVGYRLTRLWIDLDAATVSARVDRGIAVEALRHVARDAEEMGALSERELATARLRELGVRTWRRGPSASAATLSQREREIAELVSRGATNPEIASALFLSRKTVERHVSHTLAKLGARNRAELAAMLAHKDAGGAG